MPSLGAAGREACLVNHLGVSFPLSENQRPIEKSSALPRVPPAQFRYLSCNNPCGWPASVCVDTSNDLPLCQTIHSLVEPRFSHMLILVLPSTNPVNNAVLLFNMLLTPGGPQVGRLMQQKFIFSPFWRPEDKVSAELFLLRILLGL